MLEELDVLIRARYPLIAINTHEEMRAIRIITALASTQRHRDKGLFTWSRVRGLARVDGKRPQAIGDQSEDNLAVLELIDTKFESGLFVLFDFHRGLEQDHMVIRRLRQLQAMAYTSRPPVGRGCSDQVAPSSSVPNTWPWRVAHHTWRNNARLILQDLD